MKQIIKLKRADDIATYEPSEALKEIINMSIALGRPLLLAGKPGTGKTQFAHWYVYKEKGFNEVFQFNTKSTSVYNDLFYEYDAVSHFRDKSGDKDVTDFIMLTALGKAIVCAKGFKNIEDERLKNIALKSGLSDKNLNSRSLVLIDEIDKAPRDFPNDLLHEIENLSFTIKETTPTIEVKLRDEEKENIIVILTSNDEKNLPDAFLRRCLFHYIEFPNEVQLKKIILKKLGYGELDQIDTQKLKNLEDIKGFEGLHDKIGVFTQLFKNETIDKKPYTSECIDWINFLHKRQILNEPIHQHVNTLSVLLKKYEDYQEALKMLKIQ